MNAMVGLFITFWAAPGKIDALTAELEAMVPVVAREEGTLVYALHRCSGALEGVAVYEVYRDPDAQREHGLSTAVASLKERLPHLLGAPPERSSFVLMNGSKGLPI